MWACRVILPNFAAWGLRDDTVHVVLCTAGFLGLVLGLSLPKTGNVVHGVGPNRLGQLR